MTTLTARTPSDLIALVPIVLGFVPVDSIAMLTFGAPRSFHARVDMPETGGDVAAVIDVLLDAATRNGVKRVVFIAFHGSATHSHGVLDDLHRAFRAAGIDVIDRLRAHDGLWFHTAGGPGEPYDNGIHVFTTQAVADGMVIVGSREELAKRLTPDTANAITPPSVDTIALFNPDLEAEATWCHDLVARHVESGLPIGNDDAAHLLLAISALPLFRDAAWIVGTEENAHRAIEVWADLVRRAPEQLVADAAAILGFTCWLAGDGAFAWVAHDRAIAADPDNRLAARVADVLTRALNPSLWKVPSLAEMLAA